LVPNGILKLSAQVTGNRLQPTDVKNALSF
jgi:hypothetical protein